MHICIMMPYVHIQKQQSCESACLLLRERMQMRQRVYEGHERSSWCHREKMKRKRKNFMDERRWTVPLNPTSFTDCCHSMRRTVDFSHLDLRAFERQYSIMLRARARLWYDDQSQHAVCIHTCVCVWPPLIWCDSSWSRSMSELAESHTRWALRIELHN